jgi:hypothetical protein
MGATPRASSHPQTNPGFPSSSGALCALALSERVCDRPALRSCPGFFSNKPLRRALFFYSSGRRFEPAWLASLFNPESMKNNDKFLAR